MSILIHVGPPKSGTSAIQRWLSFHASELQQYGYYYPQHESDANGVSSGNLLALFSYNSEGELEFDAAKKERLITDFKKSQATVLLLSSEFFFKRITLLAEQFPTAKFVAYLRFPLEVIESSYNQGVKRHGEVKQLGVSATPKCFQLNLLENQIKKAGKQRFILRPYEKNCFTGGSLVNDFKDVLHIPSQSLQTYSTNEVVNSSYSIDALELKRWFNQFPLGDLQPVLDKLLQAYSADKPGYSLIGAKLFRTYKNEFVKVLERFCSVYHVDNSEIFIEQCKALQQKPIVKQRLSDEDFESLIKQLLGSKELSAFALYKKVTGEWRKVNHIKFPERINILTSQIAWQTKCKVRVYNLLEYIKR